MRLLSYEIQKVLKNKTIIGCLFVSLFMLSGIFYVGYYQSHSQLSGRSNMADGYTKTIDQKISKDYTGDLTDDKVKMILSDYFETYQAHIRKNRYEGPFYLFFWQVADTYINQEKTEDIYTSMIDAVNKGQRVTIKDVVLRSVNAIGFKTFQKPLKIGNYVPWGDLYKVQSNISLLTAILIMLIASLIFSEDSSRQMNQILYSTKYGRSKLISTKLWASLLLCLIIYLLTQFLNLMVFSLMYDTSGWNSSIQTNLELKFFDFPLEWNHLHLYLWMLGLHFAGLLLVTGMSLLISLFAQSPLTSFTSSLTLYLLPMFLQRVFQEGLVNTLLYLFPINQINALKLVALFSNFKVSFIITNFIGFAVLSSATLLLFALVHYFGKKWTFA